MFRRQYNCVWNGPKPVVVGPPWISLTGGQIKHDICDNNWPFQGYKKNLPTEQVLSFFFSRCERIQRFTFISLPSCRCMHGPDNLIVYENRLIGDATGIEFHRSNINRQSGSPLADHASLSSISWRKGRSLCPRPDQLLLRKRLSSASLGLEGVSFLTCHSHSSVPWCLCSLCWSALFVPQLEPFR
jgi:hypothetical protein